MNTFFLILCSAMAALGIGGWLESAGAGVAVFYLCILVDGWVEKLKGGSDEDLGN